MPVSESVLKSSRRILRTQAKSAGRGWFYNTKTKKAFAIGDGDLGPHGDHDGWISIGDNAEKLGVDKKAAVAFQKTMYGIDTEEHPQFAMFDEEGYGYVSYHEIDESLHAEFSKVFKKVFGVNPTETSGFMDNEASHLWRIRDWGNGRVSIGNGRYSPMTKKDHNDLMTMLDQDSDIEQAVMKASLLMIGTEKENIKTTGKDFVTSGSFRDIGQNNLAKPITDEKPKPTATKESTDGVWRTTEDGNRVFIESNGSVRAGGPNGPVIGAKQQRKAILACSRSLLAKTKSAAEGIWRTTDDGSKIFITEAGEVHAGGPNGKVIGGTKKQPAPKKVEKPGKDRKGVQSLPVYNGGNGKEGKFVTYHTTSKEMAESYVGMYNERFGEGGKLNEKTITINSPAPWEVVRREAMALGMDADDYTPASIFDDNLFDERLVKKLVGKLESLGHDGAILEDIAYGVTIQDDAYITFTKPKEAKPEPKLSRTVLHGTSLDRARSIIAEGIVPKSDLQKMAWPGVGDSDQGDKVYTTDSLEVAKWYGSTHALYTKQPQDFAVFEIEVPGDVEGISSGTEGGDKFQVIAYDEIPPEWIKAIHVSEGGKELVRKAPKDFATNEDNTEQYAPVFLGDAPTKKSDQAKPEANEAPKRSKPKSALEYSRQLLSQTKSAVGDASRMEWAAKSCGANGPGGGGFRDGNTCGREDSGATGKVMNREQPKDYFGKFKNGVSIAIFNSGTHVDAQGITRATQYQARLQKIDGDLDPDVATENWAMFIDEETGSPPMEYLFEDIHGGDNAHGITGKGNAREVIRKASEALEHGVYKFSPPVVFFTAAEDSRKRLYERMAKKANDLRSWEGHEYRAYKIEGMVGTPTVFVLAKSDVEIERITKETAGAENAIVGRL